MSDLSEVCADLATWLPHGAALVASQDTQPSTGRTQPASRPPWNPAAAAAVYDALETIRRTHQELAENIAERPVQRKAIRFTGQSLTAIQRLAEATDQQQIKTITQRLARHVTAIRQLPAIGEDEPWTRIQGATCPYCGMQMLLAAMQSARVTCLRFGACFDADGNHPRGVMEQGAASSQPLIAWADGTIQHPQQDTQ